MDNKESMLLSVSNHKDKARTGSNANAYAFLVAQYTQNYFDPNDSKFNHPLSHNNDSYLAFSVNLEAPPVKRSNHMEIMRKKSTKAIQTPPALYIFREEPEWSNSGLSLSLREELIYLDKHYLL